MNEILVFVRCIIILQMLVKVNNFLKVYKKLGLLVNLVTTCIVDIVPFCFYLFVWLFTFVRLCMVIGVKDPQRDGINKGGFMSMFLYTWENSIGNINDPDFDSNLPFAQKWLIWTVWWCNQFLVVIILLNFLISVISQSYENVMNSQVINHYQVIASQNREVYQFLSAIRVLKYIPGSKFVNQNKIVISLKAEDNATNETQEWTGFMQTLKKYIKKHYISTNESIQVVQKSIKTMMTEIGSMKTEVGALDKTMKTEMRVMDSKIDAVKTEISSIDSKIGAVMELLSEMNQKQE